MIAVLSLPGCKKDDQVLSTLSELDEFTSQMVQKIESAPNPAAGVDAAQAFFDQGQGSLKAKMKELGTMRGYQVSKEVRQKMESSLTANVGKVYGLKIKLMSATFQDKDLDGRLNRLVDAYTALVKGEG
jgi:hypothetical protein